VTPEERQRTRLRRKARSLHIIGGGNVRCRCCGEREIDLLTIDHIEGGGTQHRRELGARGVSIHQWIRANREEAKRRLQPLCYNCHIGKDALGGCPHKARQQLAA
jgi:hypothetical protein